MTPLERLGLEVVAYTLLGSRTQAATLCTLLDADGRTVPADLLGQARGWRAGIEAATDGTVKVRVCLLRESLDDVGLGGTVETVRSHGMHQRADGYRVNSANRARIIERLVAEAAA